MRFNLLYTHKTKGKQHKNTYIYCCHHFDLTSLILFGLCRLLFLFFASCFVFSSFPFLQPRATPDLSSSAFIV